MLCVQAGSAPHHPGYVCFYFSPGLGVFFNAVPQSEPRNFSQIKVGCERTHPEKLLGSSASGSKWALALVELMGCFITSRHPRLSECCGPDLPVTHLPPPLAASFGLITAVLITWLFPQTSCRHTGVASATPVTWADLQLPALLHPLCLHTQEWQTGVGGWAKS